MNILIYGINYTPELTGIGKYTGEMAEWLTDQGHEVRVVTAPPYYPAWQIGAGYSSGRYHCEFLKGIRVWRCPLWIPYQPSGLKRILHLASFAISSLPLMLWQGLFWRPNVVYVVEPAFFCVIGALLTSRLSGAKAWLHIQDFEIDAGFEMGLLPSARFIRSFAMTIERWLINCFDRISTISDRMLERLKAKEVDVSKCVYFPNWVDTDRIYPLQKFNSLRSELDIPPDAFVALYSGSMAEKQGLEVLIATAHLLAADHPNIIFILCGQGSARKRLLELAKGMPNIRFLNLQPLERLNALLNLANVHLLPQISDAADLVMPSKLQGMCASGQPVIGTVHRSTQVAQVLEDCGVVVPPGDITALSSAIVYLLAHPKQCSKLGQAARRFAIAHWHKGIILQKFEQELMELCPLPSLKSVGIAPAVFNSLKADIQANIHPTIQDNPIGSYLLKLGLITEFQLNIALKDQQITGMRLGEIIVKHGWLSQLTIDELMNK